MTEKIDITATLGSARQAYRFLHEFQKRLRDTVERFRQEFVGYTYCASGPIYTDVPSFRKSPHDDKWALDLFPAYAYSIRYEKHESLGRSSLLEICFHTDAEYEGGQDKLPPETPNSKTSIDVYFWVKDNPQVDSFKWQEEWNQTGDYSDIGEVFPYPVLGMKVLGIALDFEKLTDEEGIQIEAQRVKGEIGRLLNFSFAE